MFLYFVSIISLIPALVDAAELNFLSSIADSRNDYVGMESLF